jgi:hypothetical protein
VLIVRVLAFLVGLALVGAALDSAIRTLVLPRSASGRIARKTFLAVRLFFDLRTRRARDYATRDRAMALYAPMALLTLQAVWIGLVLAGYVLMYWAVGVDSFASAFKLSGSSLLTLGFAGVETIALTTLSFSEAAIGLILIALLIAYLPTMYAAFSRREVAVTLLEVRAGSPPSPTELIERYNRIGGLADMGELWPAWEVWFADVEETHTSLGALAFFRSPRPQHSWVTAAGAILDAASLANAAVDVPHDPRADLCIRAGYVALRHVAEFFQLPHETNPSPTDPISIAREEFEAACDHMAAAGVPIRSDRAAAWRAFQGWRVNYDTVLLELAALTMAPYAPWSSDRSPHLATRRLLRRPLRGAQEPASPQRSPFG